MSLYLNFTDTYIVEEDFTKTIGFELKSCHKLKAIDLNYTFQRESVKKAIYFSVHDTDATTKPNTAERIPAYRRKQKSLLFKGMYAKITIRASKEKKKQRGEIMKMTMIEALEKLAELNNYEAILVKIKDDDEPTPIDLEIDDIRKFADDPYQTFDLIVTEYTIRELDENGNEKKLGEPLYRVVK